MAGSYCHCVRSDGSFRGTELIENLGDAYEALEEMYDMIQQLTGGDKQKIHEAWLKGHIQKNPTIYNTDPRNAALYSFESFWKDEEE